MNNILIILQPTWACLFLCKHQTITPTLTASKHANGRVTPNTMIMDVAVPPDSDAVVVIIGWS